MSIKVVYDYQIFSEQKYGGISRYIYEISKEIATSKEFNVNIVSPLYINNYIKNMGKEGLVVGRHIPVIPKAGRILQYVNRILSESYIKKNIPDIIHETYYSTQDKRVVNQTKYILTIHDMIHEKLPEYFSDIDTTILNKRNAINRADHVICISESTKNDLLDFVDIENDKITVIHHGYSLCELTESAGIPIISKPYILFVGYRGGYKNFNRLLTAFYKYNLYKDFLLVCFGGGSFNKAEIDNIVSLGLSEREVLQLSGEDYLLGNLYRNATIFVYPSLYEGFGLPLLEAMGYQCPIICSNTNSFHEVAGVAVEYFDPYDIDNIGTTLCDVIYSQSIIEKLVARGSDRVSHFSWKKCSQDTMSAYRKLL